MNDSDLEGLLKIEDVLIADYVSTYKKQINILWNHLLIINTSLFYMRRIDDFPFHLFLFKDRLNFWILTRQALAESTVMAIWRIAVDKSGDTLNIRRLKNEIQKNMRLDIVPQCKRDFKLRLKEVNFDIKIKHLSKKLRRLDIIIMHILIKR